MFLFNAIDRIDEQDARTSGRNLHEQVTQIAA